MFLGGRGVGRNLEASRACWGEAVLEGTSEGIEHDSLANSLRQVGRQVAEQDGCIGPDRRFLIYLQTHGHLNN